MLEKDFKNGLSQGLNRPKVEHEHRLADSMDARDEKQPFHAYSILPTNKSRQRQSDLMAASADQLPVYKIATMLAQGPNQLPSPRQKRRVKKMNQIMKQLNMYE